MGPTNVALVKLFQVDQKLRQAQGRLEVATKDVRVQERRVHDLAEKHKLAQSTLRETQSKAANLELDLRSRDAHIEKLRGRQQNTTNNKEYQAILVEISTCKVDRNKVEDETMKLLESVERGQAELKTLAEQHEAEKAKLATMKEQMSGRVAARARGSGRRRAGQGAGVIRADVGAVRWGGDGFDLQAGSPPRRICVQRMQHGSGCEYL